MGKSGPTVSELLLLKYVNVRNTEHTREMFNYSENIKNKFIFTSDILDMVCMSNATKYRDMIRIS